MPSSTKESQDFVHKRLKELLRPPNAEGSEGIKKFFHGILYQVKLSLCYCLYLWQSKMGKKDYCVGAEVAGGGKFDDLVVITKSANGTNKISIFFLQAKHSQDGSNKISFTDIIKDNYTQNPYSLPKYFSSYQLIKKNPDFSAYEIEKCYLCTNCELGVKVEEITCDVLNPNPFFLKEDGRLRKLNSNSNSEDKNILCNLLRNTNPFTILAQTMAKHVVRQTKMIKNNPLYAIYHVALLNENILVKSDNTTLMFHQNFVEDKLNGNAAEFRKEFLKWYCKEKSYSCDKFADDDDEIKKELKETIIKTVSKFGKAFVKKAIHAFDFDKFAKELFLLVNGAVDITSIKCNRKKIGKQSDGMNENLINLLAGYVFVYAENEKCAKFRTSFSSNKFKEDLNNLISNENVDKEETILNLIKFKKAFENQFTVNFNLKDKIQFKGIEKCRFNVNDYESSYEKEPEQKLPLNEEIKDEEIYEFFDKFVFAVNQPNEIRLGEIIAESLKKNLNLSDPKLYADHLIMKAIDWAKDKNGGYLDGINIDEFIAEIHQQKSNLALSSRSSTNRNRFKKYGNNHEISDLSSFLLKNKKNVLWLSAVNPLSIATMVDSTLKKMNSKFKYDDEVIIITLSDLENMPEDVSSAFKYGKADLMIIIAEPDNCDDIDDEVIMDVGNALSKIIAEKKEKKIVIISNENNVLPNCFKKNVQKVTAAFNSYNTTNSTKLVKFQNKYVSVTDLIDALNPIHEDAMVKLMSYKRIKIGNRLKISNNSNIFYPKPTDDNNKMLVVKIKEKRKISSLVSNIAAQKKKQFPNFWVAEIKLRDAIKQNKKNPTISTKNLLILLLKSNFNSSFDETIFSYLCDQRRTILIINAVDKINSSYLSNNVIELFKKMQYRTKETWIFATKQFQQKLPPLHFKIVLSNRNIFEKNTKMEVD